MKSFHRLYSLKKERTRRMGTGYNTQRKSRRIETGCLGMRSQVKYTLFGNVMSGGIPAFGI